MVTDGEVMGLTKEAEADLTPLVTGGEATEAGVVSD